MCIPAEGLLPPPDECGVFVSASAPAGGDGTKENPFSSLNEALAGATEITSVYACGALYEEAITVPAGVWLYGGLDCNDFRYAPDTALTVIAPPPGAVPIRVQGAAEALKLGVRDTRIVDVRAVAKPAPLPGGSSIAAIVDRTTLVLVRSKLIAGDAKDGADGEPFAEEAPPGEDGEAGGTACSATEVPGGPAVLSAWEGGESIGGKGGGGVAKKGYDGDDGSPFERVNHGLGAPEDDPAGRCSEGKSGKDGESGGPGHGGIGPGRVDVLGYTGVRGADGVPGSIAQGGGGGGGAKGGFGWTCAAPANGGAGGGSGGSGGGGGKGGRGGGAGGSSIALISLWSHLVFEEVALEAKRGGRGGNGGTGQIGGKGGAGGPGGTAIDQLLPGCHGGKGGRGGKGGGGGGGNGGHSIGIAVNGEPPTMPDVGLSISTSAPGAGGTGEGPDGDGGAGMASVALTMDPP